MTRKRRKKRRHRQPPLPPRGPSLEEILAEAQALQEEGRLEEALAVLEEAPPHLQHRLELLVFRAGLYMLMGDLVSATALFEEARQLAPDDPIIDFFLGSLYYDRDWVIHARQAIRRALDRSLPNEMVADAQAILAAAEEAIRETAESFDLSFEKAEELLRYVEEAEQEARRERFREAAHLFHQAAQIAPAWTDLRINEAIFRFFDGEVDEAIRIGEEVLAEGEEKLHALANLVRFYLARGEREKAEACAQELRTLRLENPADVDKLVEALGFLEDDETLFAIYRRHRQTLGDLNGITLLVLGSAAANLGHPRIAHRLWQMAEEAGVHPSILWPLEDALSRKAPGPAQAQRYPTVALPSLISPMRLAVLFELADDWREDRIDGQTLERRIDEFVRRNPYTVQAVAKAVWEEKDPTSGIYLLGLIGTPEAIAELKRFAFGQAGAKPDRLYALEVLAELDQIDLSKPVRVWDEKEGTWQEIKLIRQEITTEVEPLPYSPEVWELLGAGTEALARGDLKTAREKLEAAIALDPQAAMAHHNLSLVLEREGDRAGAREHLEKALEVNPHYVHARCSLARHLLADGELEAARAVMMPISEYPVLTPSEWEYYQRVMAQVAIAHKRYDVARAYLKSLLEMYPEDETLQDMLMRVTLLESLESPFWKKVGEQTRQREERKRHRPTRLDAGLVECLERLTKDALIGTARAMPVPRKYNVRKAILIQDLAQYLTTPSELRKIVQALREEERQALRDVLEAGGWVDWETFTSRYDHDLDESPYWQWHEPETVMGRLRMLGLLSEGTVDDQLIVLVPRELRELLPPLLEE